MGLPAKVERVPVLRDLLVKQAAAFRDVLPKHLTTERLVRIACAAASRNQQLLQCTTTSLLSAIMTAAQLGLEPSGALGSAYLVPFRNKGGNLECQLIVGYRGLIDLARRSGQIASIEAHVVHANEPHKITYGLTPVLEHQPLLEGDPGKPVAVYAIARLRDGTMQHEVMTYAQVEAIRNRSRAGQHGPWMTDWEEMARKTCVKRLAKYLPLSTELAEAIDTDNRIEAGEAVDILAELEPGEAPPTALETAKRKAKARITIKDSSGAELDPAPEISTATSTLDELPEWAGGERQPGVDDEPPAA